MWRKWVEVGLVVLWLEQRLLPLFLVAQDLNSVLRLRQSCFLSIDVLSLGFDTLDYYLPPNDGFLFLTEPFNLLLDSEQLLFLCSFFLEGFFFPVLYLDLLNLDISMNNLYWQRCPRG
jgi:hypothetical protein